MNIIKKVFLNIRATWRLRKYNLTGVYDAYGNYGGSYSKLVYAFDGVTVPKLERALKSIIKTLDITPQSIKSVVVSKDKDGEEYLKLPPPPDFDLDMLCDLLAKHYNGVIELELDIFGTHISNGIINIYKWEEERFSTIVLSFPDTELVRDHSLSGAVDLDNRILKLFLDTYDITHYDCAHTQSEADFSLSPSEIKAKSDTTYGIQVLPIIKDGIQYLKIMRGSLYFTYHEEYGELAPETRRSPETLYLPLAPS